MKMESAETAVPLEQTAGAPVTEPAQAVATETIPPTAAPQVAAKPASVVPQLPYTNQDVQRALKAAGVYAGAIDGKIGPKTKAAIEEFQRSKGLKVDGKVGPKTWSELAKYLKMPQQ
jgi:peptidoglycan hydrolase-like protein with peptidoglycan-binding domain